VTTKSETEQILPELRRIDRRDFWGTAIFCLVVLIMLAALWWAEGVAKGAEPYRYKLAGVIQEEVGRGFLVKIAIEPALAPGQACIVPIRLRLPRGVWCTPMTQEHRIAGGLPYEHWRPAGESKLVLAEALTGGASLITVTKDVGPVRFHNEAEQAVTTLAVKVMRLDYNPWRRAPRNPTSFLPASISLEEIKK
jgi:hypothetical protein